MKTAMRWGALFFLTTTVYASNCESMARAYWKVDTQLKKVEWLKVSQKMQKFCAPLVEDSAANVLLTFQAGKKTFTRRLLVPLETIHEQLDAKKELKPTIVSDTVVYLDSPIPLWAQKSQVKITEIANGKLLGSGEAKP